MSRLIWLGAIWLGLAAQSNAQMGKIDTKHVSDQSFCVLRIDIERLMGHLKKSKKDLEMISKEMESEIQMDIKDIKVMTMQFGDSDVDDGSPSFSVTFELSKDLDQDAFVEKVGEFESFTEATINGKTYLKPDSDHGPHLYFASKRKFTAATPGALAAILKSGTGMGQMSSRLKSAPPGSELTAVFHRSKDFDASVEEIVEDLKFPGIPFDFQRLLATGESGLAYLNLTSETPLFIQTQFKTVSAAEEARQGLKKLMELGKTSVPLTKTFVTAQIRELKGAEGFQAMEREMFELGLDGLNVAEKMLTALQLKQKKNVVELSVRQMGGIPEIADLMAGGLKLTILGVAGVDGPPPGAIEDAKELPKIER